MDGVTLDPGHTTNLVTRTRGVPGLASCHTATTQPASGGI